MYVQITHKSARIMVSTNNNHAAKYNEHEPNHAAVCLGFDLNNRHLQNYMTTSLLSTSDNLLAVLVAS
jgi:hypothetical protein